MVRSEAVRTNRRFRPRPIRGPGTGRGAYSRRVTARVKAGVATQRATADAVGPRGLPAKSPTVLVKGRSSLQGFIMPGFPCSRTQFRTPCLASTRNVTVTRTGITRSRRPVTGTPPRRGTEFSIAKPQAPRDHWVSLLQ